jgi:hypothetical protein
MEVSNLDGYTPKKLSKVLQSRVWPKKSSVKFESLNSESLIVDMQHSCQRKNSRHKNARTLTPDYSFFQVKIDSEFSATQSEVEPHTKNPCCTKSAINLHLEKGVGYEELLGSALAKPEKKQLT